MPKRLWFMDVCGFRGKRVRLCQAYFDGWHKRATLLCGSPKGTLLLLILLPLQKEQQLEHTFAC